MGVFRQFPYSNFHEMNMDEMIKIIKNMLEEWAKYYAEWDKWMNEINEDWSNYQEVMNEAWQNMQNFINNYFDNLDVQEEINNKIVSMVQTGEFGNIVSPYIPSSVTEWLSTHITEPTGVVIDTSLTVAGACADAKATGDAITSSANEVFSGLNFNVWDEVWEPGILDDTSGQNSSSPLERVRTKNWIPVFSATRYYIKSPEDLIVFFYDSTKTVILINGGAYQLLKNRTVRTPENARYMRFYTVSEYGPTYTNDICINLSQTSEVYSPRNGDYVPFRKNSKIFFDISKLLAIDGNFIEPTYVIKNFAFGADLFDNMGVNAEANHRYVVAFTPLVNAYAQVGVIASGAWKASQSGRSASATFTAPEVSTFYFRKTSGEAQTIDTIYIFDTTDNDALQAFVYGNLLKSVEIPFNGAEEKNNRSWYFGKKWSALGDSITEQESWFLPLREKFMFLDTVNCGIGGSSIGGTGNDAMFKDSRINSISTDTDFITIMGGTNDSAANRPIGEISRANHDTATFIGAYNVLLSKIFYKFHASADGYYNDVDYSNITRVSTTKPIYILLITCGFDGLTASAGDNYERMESLADACVAVGKLWGLPVADIYHNAGINPITYSEYLADSLHPNIEGGKRLASVIIGSMIINEPVA